MLNNKLEYSPGHREKIKRMFGDVRVTNKFLRDLFLNNQLIIAGVPIKDLGQITEAVRSEKDPSKLIEIIMKVTPEERKLEEDIMNVKREQLLVIPTYYCIPKDEANKIVKNIGKNYLRIHHKKVLSAAVLGCLPDNEIKWTKGFVEKNRIWPSTLLKKSVELLDDNSIPPIGYAWRGFDTRMRGVSFSRDHDGARKYAGDKAGVFKIEIGKLYGRNIEALVESVSKDEKKMHQVPLTHLPVFRKNDPKQYSTGYNIVAYDVSKGKIWVSLMHDSYESDSLIYSSPEIAAILKANFEISEQGGMLQGRVNPFAIPLESQVNYTDKILDHGIIIDRKGRKRKLNDTEISRLVGVRIKNQRNNFINLYYFWRDIDPSTYMLKGLDQK